MQRIGRGVAMVASVALAAGVALAGDRMGGVTEREATGTAAVTGAGCSHQMTGTVKELDETTGTVAIDVPGGNAIELHLAPNELAQFREGDQVVLSMGIREARPGRGTAGRSR